MLPFNVWAQSLWETLYMVIVSTVISYAIGLPLGLTLVVTDKGGIRPMPIVNTVLGVVVNILRSVPFLILAVMITPITRAIVGKAIGTTAMIVPLTFAAAPYVARMVESSIKEVPFGVIEAAQSMGASPWQIVWKVLVPEAKPSLMVGGAISVVTILGYSYCFRHWCCHFPASADSFLIGRPSAAWACGNRSYLKPRMIFQK